MNLMQLLGVKSKETLGGRYKLIQPLGQGGFGHTFLATDLHLPDHPTCVIKQLKPHLQDTESLATARRLFETEARVLYQLGEHDQIPRLLAHFEDGQEFYLAQELIGGSSLSDLIRPGQPWSEARVRRLLTEILTPLAFVHDQGVIHRDLKPSNLIHRRSDGHCCDGHCCDGHIVLIDFGAVKQVSERCIQDSSDNITRTISIGTQGYMPSEQLAGNPWFSSDLYAVGMICLQALTGTAAHLLPRDPATSEIVWQSPDLDISPAFKAILARMVRYDFRDRYATATEVLSELATLPAVPIVPLSLENAETEISRPTQVIAPAKPSSHQLSAQSRNQQRPKTKSPRSTVIPTLAVEKLGLPVLSQALPTAPTVAALLSNKPMGRWSMVGLAVLTVGALGLLRNGPTSPPVVTQSVAAPTEPAATPVVKAPSPPPAEAESLPPPAAEQVASPPVQTPPPEIANEAPAAAQPSADVLLAKAQDLRDRNQYNEALQVYDQLTEQTPDKPEAHWGQCYSLNQLQNYNQAVAACDRALAIAPDHIQALLSKGYALEQQGQPQAALELYDQALQVDPDYIDAWNNRGGILFRQQRFQEALTAFDRAREIDPGFAEAWNNRGAALWELRQFDDAVSSIDQALTLQPDYPEAQKLREQIRQKLGR